VELYTRAIDASPSGSQAHVLYANRAAALTRIGKHAEALEDGRCACMHACCVAGREECRDDVVVVAVRAWQAVGVAEPSVRQGPRPRRHGDVPSGAVRDCVLLLCLTSASAAAAVAGRC
jgi:hypothetical protein